MKARVSKEDLLIPREIVERLGHEEVETVEEPGRLLIAPAGGAEALERNEGRAGSSGGKSPSTMLDEVRCAPGRVTVL